MFFKKRAVIEEDYGKTMQKVAKATSEVYALSDGKAGYDRHRYFNHSVDRCAICSSFVSAWQTSMRIHEMMADNRLRFSQRLNEMSEELNNLVKEVDKNRKQVGAGSRPGQRVDSIHQTKDLAMRYERALQESEQTTEKSKHRLDFTTEELERVLLQKEGESTKDTGMQNRAGATGGKRVIGKAVAKGGMLLKGKNPGNVSVYLLPVWFYLMPSRSSGRRMIFGPGCLQPLINIGKPFWTRRR